MVVRFTTVRDDAIVPTRGSVEAAGYDLSAAIDNRICIPPHCTSKIGTGLVMELPSGTFGAVYPRSGIASREGLRPANCVGVIDSDYRGEIIVALHNDSEEYRFVEPGQRIAQLIVQPYVAVEYEKAEKLSGTKRGAGGFGHTGK